MGHRLLLGKDKCTVRFVGEIPSYENYKEGDIWVGVEWDTLGRGKNNGTLGDTSYFDCTPDMGSFLKLEKAKSGCGLDFLLALREKYEVEAGVDKDDLFVYSVRDLKMSVDFVGVEKIQKRQQNYFQADNVSLSGGRLAFCPTVAGSIFSTCPHIQQLDLSFTLLADFREVCLIVCELPLLAYCRLSGNKFVEPDTASLAIAVSEREKELGREEKSGMQALQTIVLNQTSLRWNVATSLLSLFPNLSELHFCGNALVATPLEQSLNQLQVLNLEDNGLDSWEKLAETLGRLPKLRKLLLSKNPLQTITAIPFSFLQLESISLAETRIAAWSDIDALNHYSHLQELRLQNVPLTETEGSRFVRMMAIARIEKLAHMNGSVVRAVERRDSEKMYLKNAFVSAMQQVDAPASENAMQTYLHSHWPRYAALCKVHGDPGAEARKEAQMAAHGGSAMITLTLRAENDDSVGSEVNPEVTRRLPMSLEIHKLRMVVKQAFKQASPTIQLRYRDPSDPLMPAIVLADDMKTLSYYGLISGGVVVWEDVDLNALDSNDEKSKQELLMELQLKEAENQTLRMQEQIAKEKQAIQSQANK